MILKGVIICQTHCLQEVDTDEDDCENLIKEDKVCKGDKKRETCSFTSSPAPPLTTHSILHGEEVDLSPRSIALLEAGEGAGKQGIEKLLLVSGVNKSQSDESLSFVSFITSFLTWNNLHLILLVKRASN